MAYNFLDHAKHNEELCDIINDLGKFNDWVITTAFYSSKYYLEHKIFPLEKNGVIHNSFKDYCNYHGVKGQKHREFKNVVKNHCPQNIFIDYQRLLDASYTARYNNYSFTKNISDVVRNRLFRIKAYCSVLVEENKS